MSRHNGTAAGNSSTGLDRKYDGFALHIPGAGVSEEVGWCEEYGDYHKDCIDCIEQMPYYAQVQYWMWAA
jgi:hypothetical protein